MSRNCKLLVYAKKIKYKYVPNYGYWAHLYPKPGEKKFNT